jgi:serine/threonine-protein kinase RsbW
MCSGPELIKRCVEIPSDLRSAKSIEQEILNQAQQLKYPEEDVFAIRLAFVEAVSNAIIHGNRGDPSKHIRIEYEICPHQVRIRIQDEGEGFDPTSVPDPTLPEHVDRPSGRGLLLMRHYMSARVLPPGNCVELTRHKRPGNCSPS